MTNTEKILVYLYNFKTSSYKQIQQDTQIKWTPSCLVTLKRKNLVTNKKVIWMWCLTALWLEKAFQIVQREKNVKAEVVLDSILPKKLDPVVDKKEWMTPPLIENPCRISLVKKTYIVSYPNEKWNFEYWANGISIPNHLGEYSLQFENSKINRVKNFYKALWLFLKEVEWSGEL